MEAMEIDRESMSQNHITREDKEEEEERGKLNPIVVLLVGAPGSGKSTFCDHVMMNCPRPWARICQDTINNGKAGTKIQCLTSAGSALKDGKSVFIDRCNLDREQRADFLKLGGPQVEKHAVVLDLPAKLCISRSVKRSGHEGNLQGGKAAAVVNRMLQKKELPKLGEGFTRITFCQDEKDVQETINTYNALGPSDSLSSGCFGQKNANVKIQLGIMKFLKKVDSPGDASSEANVSQKCVHNEVSKEKDHGIEGTQNCSVPSGHACEDVKDCDKVEMTSVADGNASDNIPTLAFPSISTADFQFNLEKASDIIVEKVEEFINKIGKARLVLVDLSHGSKILSLVRTKAAKKNVDPNKFFTVVGDITRLHSGEGLNCNVIANAANWRLKPGGGGVNAAIFSAAGLALESATKERAGSLKPGKAVVVPLPPTSPLFTREGVTHVIHVLGPNMNPQRPNFLNNDYVQGCEVLREAYTSLFEGFASIVRSYGGSSKGSSGRSVKSETSPTNGGQKVKREAVYESDVNKKYKGFQKDLKPGVRNYLNGKEDLDKEDGGGMTKAWGSWAKALYNIAMHPDKHKNVVIEILDDVVVLNDLYPKAQRHLLVLARGEGLDCLADVRREHLSLLKTMHAVGLKWTEKFLDENKSLTFRLGYHSVPSMRQLHLHVISQDFNSQHLKNKKHWNSFNTPFFRDSVDVIQEVSDHGKVVLKNEDNILSMELRCHRCRSAHPNIPRLRSHISSCQASFPASLLQNGRLVFVPSEDGTGK
ncbi:Transcription factor bHLH [Abeliophyllum distichum]|uniref:Transcription factor bHLH n=1 Tax=Abeliophyllum distichum TaxID=126358 RepID=A0ABD1R8V2_9LAMI